MARREPEQLRGDSAARVDGASPASRCRDSPVSTPIRLPLSQRQAEALARLLSGGISTSPLVTPDDAAALREVAGKLDTLREK